MIKSIYTLILLFPFVLCSCSDDKDSDFENGTTPNVEALKVTYKVTTTPALKTFAMVSYNDAQGNYIVKEVESGWSLDVELPKGKKAFLSGTVNIKEEYLEEVNIHSAKVKVQIIQNGKVTKEAEGLSIVAEIEP